MIWVYGPLLWTGALSVLDWNLISPDPEFVGVENYVELFGRPETTNAIVRTGFYVLGMLPFATVIPMTLALLLWRRPGRAAEAYRALLFSPVVLAPLATAISWKFLLSPEQGLVDTVLSGSGLPSPNWLGDPRTALPVIVVITAGKIVALNVVLFSAALAGIDRRSIEAARIDGATGWETTRYVVLPQLARTVVLLTALCVVVAGQWVFTNVAVLTRGGPDGATGRRGDGATGRRGDGATGRRGDGATGRRGDGATGRRGDGATGRRGDGATDNIYYRLYAEGFDFFDAGAASALAVTITATLAVAFGAIASARRRSHDAR
ncbi:Aldehyde dehydrogenase [Pseudonocardia sp. Ae150A_Ps1]|nr:Aldehyde dehydrogenase [Pseudonocardia sp. Ae150A_Ps1]